jgi:Nucleotidyltransferase domain
MLPNSAKWRRIDRLWYGVAMRCAEAISLLKLHEAELKQLGVEHLYMFGSTARNAARSDSDIDRSMLSKPTGKSDGSWNVVSRSYPKRAVISALS